ncbi:DUF72 domain-containing protein [Allopusillimonas soli]|uniref:DUF72 domain-containing protein n=1 Tax=Allopusillimonas soli TaxID=659016 RepID=A0A853FDJ9_9BURK|nr:DUF72 domain-containing protein [Allopusillimonas soli]NYT36591.1 DUF72 domain-containing protein [Allopusillimonas soli]TEA75082.1 DUF72 domain-containing protein [Allopusillimonas soli]
MSRIRVGISGWRYAGWRSAFYPDELPQRRELEYASRAMQTIEINGTHYSLQTPDRFMQWRQATPRGFRFSVKGPRYLTHVLRFRDSHASRTALANFLASGLLNLQEKLGPLLWQFPPNFKFDRNILEAMLASLPHTTHEAAALAARHDGHVKDVCVKADRNRRLHHVIEVRHESFCEPDFITMLRKHHVGLVISDSVKNWPYAEDVTSGIVYVRLHGTHTAHGGRYGDQALDRWAERLRTWSQGREPDDAVHIMDKRGSRRAGREVYCYFDNDEKVQAPADAQRLMEKI